MQRKLGFWEAACVYFHDQFHSSNVGAVVNVSGIIDRNFLQEAVYILFRRHPLLRCVIKKEQEEYFFAEEALIENIPLRVSKRTKLDHWKEVIEDEIAEKFPCEQYLWKLVMLEDPKIGENDIIAVFHHAISDGLSVFRFFQDLLRCYILLVNGADVDLKPLPFLPSVENLVQNYKSIKKYREEREEISAAKISQWKYQQTAPLELRKPKHLYIIFDEKKLHHVLKRSKSNGVSVNSALNAALGIACSRLYNEALTLNFGTPVQLRNFCKPPLSTEHIGCYFAVIPEVFENITPNVLFWDFAKKYEKTLKHHIPLLGFNPTDYHMEDIKHLFIREPKAASTADQGPFQIAVSNIGNMDEETTFGPLRMNSFFFNTAQVSGGQFVILHAATFDKKMFCCFSFTYPLLAEETMQRFTQIFSEVLDEAIRFENK